MEKVLLSKKEFAQARKDTLDSFVKVDDQLYMQHFTAPYSLDKLINKGVANMVELVAFVQKEMAVNKKLLFGTYGFGCTTFNAYKSSGEHLFARNFDYRECPSLVYWSSPKNGYKSIAFATSCVMLYDDKYSPIDSSKNTRTLLAPYVCADGINEKGLVMAVLEIKTEPTKQFTGKRPIIPTVAIRAILDKCATVDEALDFLKGYDMRDAFGAANHFHIVDESGKSVVVEYINNKMKIVESEQRNQYAMNFFLSPEGDNSNGFGYERRDAVIAYLARTEGTMDEKECMSALKDCRMKYTSEKGYPVSTRWSAVYNCQERSVTLASGMDYEHIYKLRLDKPCEIERLENFLGGQ